MSIPKTTQMPTSVTHYSDLDLSCQHITTGNFMEFNVAKAMELVPRQSINIDMTTFTRLEPMPVPTFGIAEIHNRAFFVPYRTVMRGWNEFIEDTSVVNSQGDEQIPVVPRINNSSFIDLYRTHRSFTAIVQSPDQADIQVFASDGSIEYYRFTPLGKYSYKLFTSLGYRISFDLRAVGMTHSALPMLCLMRVFFDWYYPSAYVDDAVANELKRWFEFEPTENVNYFASEFDDGALRLVVEQLHRVSYDSDYFVSAWDNPVAPNEGAYSGLLLKDPTAYNDISVDNNAFENGTASIQGELTQFAVDALKAVSDAMKRYQIAGARVLDRYLARWGVRLPDAKLNISTFIGEAIRNLRFGDVTATSDTYRDGSGSSLGSYAGMGFGRVDAESFVDFSTTEFGQLIIISTIVPKTSYYQGQDRCTFHLDKYDFYTPDFDNLGVQALATRELYVPQLGDYSRYNEEAGIDFDKAVFGFVPRYAEYKRGYDNMTGDYVLRTKNVGKEGWTLMRDVSSFFRSETPYEDIAHSQSFVESNDASQYNRIFYITDNNEDKFNIIHNFVIKSRFPGKSLYDSYEFKDYDKAQKVTIDVNGVRAN